VVLDAEAVGKTITLNESDVKTYYEQNAQRMSGAEERRASHILLNAPKSAPVAEREAAKTQYGLRQTQVDEVALVGRRAHLVTIMAKRKGDF
jgi:parvulin-like peptidyl-prolyl isomerase